MGGRVLPWKATKATKGFIYFIRRGWNGPIKIGWALDPWRRLGELQIGSATRLRLIGIWPGTMADEHELHKQLAEHRTRGEWFVLPAETLKEIRQQVTPVLLEEARRRM
jgi:hypothetical protein